MSIATTIGSLEAAGKLTRFAPRSRHPPKRRLYLATSALKDLQNPSSAVNLLVGRGYIFAALERWTLGARVFGDRKGGRFVKPLDPPPNDIWEIRVTEPVVQGRLLGRFPEPDTIVLTQMHTRPLLGKRGSSEWEAAMKNCENVWIDLFGKMQPFRGPTIHHYVSENCDDFPI